MVAIASSPVSASIAATRFSSHGKPTFRLTSGLAFSSSDINHKNVFRSHPISTDAASTFHKFESITHETVAAYDAYNRSTGMTPVEPNRQVLANVSLRSRRGSIGGSETLPNGQVASWRFHSLGSSALMGNHADLPSRRKAYDAAIVELTTKPMKDQKVHSANAIKMDIGNVSLVDSQFVLQDVRTTVGVSGLGITATTIKGHQEDKNAFYRNSWEAHPNIRNTFAGTKLNHSEPHAQLAAGLTFENRNNMGRDPQVAMVASYPNAMCDECGDSFKYVTPAGSFIGVNYGRRFPGAVEGYARDFKNTDSNINTRVSIFKPKPEAELKDNILNKRELSSLLEHHLGGTHDVSSLWTSDDSRTAAASSSSSSSTATQQRTINSFFSNSVQQLAAAASSSSSSSSSSSTSQLSSSSRQSPHHPPVTQIKKNKPKVEAAAAAQVYAVASSAPVTHTERVRNASPFRGSPSSTRNIDMRILEPSPEQPSSLGRQPSAAAAASSSSSRNVRAFQQNTPSTQSGKNAAAASLSSPSPLTSSPRSTLLAQPNMAASSSSPPSSSYAGVPSPKHRSMAGSQQRPEKIILDGDSYVGDSYSSLPRQASSSDQHLYAAAPASSGSSRPASSFMQSTRPHHPGTAPRSLKLPIPSVVSSQPVKRKAEHPTDVDAEGTSSKKQKQSRVISSQTTTASSNQMHVNRG
jgi:hypothetical protein